MPKSKTPKIKRYVIIPDTHGELVDRQAFECVLQAVELIKPFGVIHLGDLGEWSSVNHHRYKKRRLPDPAEISKAVRRDVTAVRRYILDPLDNVCKSTGVKHKIMLTGNHDNWLNRFVDANPDYANTHFGEATGYSFEQIFDWAARGWELVPCGKLRKIGKLNFYHGHLYGGRYHTNNHLMRMGVNIVYGHWHDFQALHVTHATGPKCAYSLGCLKRSQPEHNSWLGYRPVNWSHMFGVVDFYQNGRFSIHPVPIIYGKCTLLGSNKVIDGTKPRKLRPAYDRMRRF